MTIFLFIWWTSIVMIFSNTFPRPFDDTKNFIFYVGGGLLVALTIWQRGIAIQRSWLNGGIIAYFIIAALSIIDAPGRYVWGFSEMAQLAIWLGIAWMLSQQDQRTITHLALLSIFSTTIITTITLLTATGFISSPYYGTFLIPIGHVSYYCNFMALQLPLLIYLAYLPSKAVVRCFLILPTLAVAAGIWISAARASLLGILIGILFMGASGVALRLWRKRTIVVVLISCAALLFLLNFSSIPTIRGNPTERIWSMAGQTLNGASSERWNTWIATAQMTLERPMIGWGLDNFRFTYPEFAYRDSQGGLVSSTTWYMHPHNEIMHQVVELGIPGLLLFLVGCFYLYRRGLKGISKRNQDDQIMILVALTGITINLVDWQFSTNYIMPLSRLMTAFCIGLLFHATRLNDNITSFKIRYLAIIIILSLTLKVALNQIALGYVQRAQTVPKLLDRIAAARSAVELAPYNFDAQFMLSAHLLSTNVADAAPILDRLYNEYPFVPAVLYMKGVLAQRNGNTAAARGYLEHCLRNDPSNASALQLLKSITH